MTKKSITVSYQVSYEVEIFGGSCGNCQVEAPDPPELVLINMAKNWVRLSATGSASTRKPTVKVGSMLWNDWMPDGWTAGQHARVPLLCPACTELVVNALATRRKDEA